MSRYNYFDILKIFDFQMDGPIPAQAVVKLQEWGLIPKEGEYKCENGHGFILSKSSCAVDGWEWRCRKSYKKNKRNGKCNSSVSIRKNTFFNRSHLSICKIVTFCYFWVENMELTKIMKEARLAKQTAVDWNSFAREVLLHSLSVEEYKLGGIGKEVEIDESKIGRRKYHRGHAVEGQWVFGGVERGSNKCFFVPVEDRSRETLVSAIKEYILPGTTIISDCWKAYETLESEGYVYFSVNHSENFRDPLTGQHTNTIEGLWRHLKKYLPHYNRRKYFFNGYIQKFQFIRRCRSLDLDALVEFFKFAGKLYSPLAPSEREDLEWQPEDEDDHLEMSSDDDSD